MGGGGSIPCQPIAQLGIPCSSQGLASTIYTPPETGWHPAVMGGRPLKTIQDIPGGRSRLFLVRSPRLMSLNIAGGFLLITFFYLPVSIYSLKSIYHGEKIQKDK